MKTEEKLQVHALSPWPSSQSIMMALLVVWIFSTASVLRQGKNNKLDMLMNDWLTSPVEKVEPT